MSRTHTFARAMVTVASLTAVAIAPLAHAGTTPLSTSFSYQGVLNSGGGPYNGTADLRFTLWEVAAGAPQVSGTSEWASTNVTVTDGSFSTEINFGGAAFDGNERWLEIRVRTPHDPGDTQPFTLLTPRQKFSAVPYALQALNSLIAGTQPNAVAFSNAGNTYSGSSMLLDGGTLRVDPLGDRVGIGTATPQYRLHIVSIGSPVVLDTGSPGGGLPGYWLKNLSATVGVYSTNSNDVWLGNVNAGGVILGTYTSPNVADDRLHVFPNGMVRIGDGSGPPPTSRLQVVDGPSGVTAYGDASLTLERNAPNYLNVLAPNAHETGILFGKPAGGPSAGGIIYNNAGTPDGLQFRANGNVNRMVISSEGNVGIGGITVPAARLDVFNGQDPSVLNTAIFRIATPGSNYSHVHNGPNGDWYIRSAANAGKVIIQDSGGNVGIGIGTPSHKLTVKSPNDATLRLMGPGSFDTLAKLQFQDPGYAHIHNDGDGMLNIHANTRLALTGGFVGIGTSTPMSLLYVKGGSMVVERSDGNNAGIGINNGTTPVMSMTVSGSDSIWANSNNGSLIFSTSPGWPTPLTERMRIVTSTGFVGIGTPAPTMPLSVVGSAGKTDGPFWSVFSDARLKTNIHDLPAGSLERLLALRGREFQYTDDAVKQGLGASGKRIGFIAQEVQDVFPEWIDQTSNGYLSLTERGTSALMVEALRELRAEKDAEISALRSEVSELRAALQQLLTKEQ